MTESIEIIAGIYEGYVLGYRVQIDREEDKLPNVQISRSFAGEFHTRSVRSLATCTKFLASGGADDRIRVYDLEHRAEIKELFHHVGNVTCVVFVDEGKYLISGGEDGRILFTNTRTWTIENEWKNAHKGAVRCIAVHPEGALALTIGADLMLRTWDLMTAKNIFTTSLKNKTQYGGIVEIVRWSPDGEHFAVAGAKCVEVYNVELGDVVRSHKVDHRTTDLCWIGDADLMLGMDNGEMLFFNVETDEKNIIPAHEARLKAMAYADGILATISSAGELCLWSISEDYTEIVQLRAYNLECRPTCMCIVESSKLGLTFDEEKEFIAEDETKDDVKSEADKGLSCSSSKKSKEEESRVIIEYEETTPSKKQKHTEDDEKPEEFKGQKKKAQTPQNDERPKNKKNFKKKNFKKRNQAMAFEETDADGTSINKKGKKKVKYVQSKVSLS